MRKGLLFLLFFSLIVHLHGQSAWSWQRQSNWTVLFGVGSSSYYGELKASSFAFDLNLAIIGGAEYRLTDYISIRGELTYYKLSASDVEDGTEWAAAYRNLSFEANNFELSTQAVFNAYPEDVGYFETPVINPYGFIGLALTTQNPKADLNGQKVSLRPLHTEGVSYGAVALAIPFGIGAKISLARNLNLMVDGGLRFTLTDYLDDVSSQYVDNSSFSDPVAQALADRRPELGLSLREAGVQRGNPDIDDYYFILSVKASYAIVAAPTSTRGFSFKSRKYYTDKKAKRFRKKMKRQTNKRRKRRK